jgi:hypothetical protein
MEKLCCFCDIGSSFLHVFPKMQQNFCDSDIWIGTEEFTQNAGNRISEVVDFKISQGRIPPDSPTNARSYVCISHLRSWIRPWCKVNDKWHCTTKYCVGTVLGTVTHPVMPSITSYHQITFAIQCWNQFLLILFPMEEDPREQFFLQIWYKYYKTPQKYLGTLYLTTHVSKPINLQ